MTKGVEYRGRLLEYVSYFHQLQVEWYGMGYFGLLKVEVFSAPGDPMTSPSHIRQYFCSVHQTGERKAKNIAGDQVMKCVSELITFLPRDISKMVFQPCLFCLSFWGDDNI